MSFSSWRMPLRICGSLSRMGKNCSNVLSVNSFRGLKSFNEIPRASDIMESGGHTYWHKFVDDNHKKLGSIFIAEIEGKDCVFISDPDNCMAVIKDGGQYPKHVGVESWKLYLEESNKSRGLFFMEETPWLEARRVFNKIMMLPESMRYYVQSIAQISSTFVEMWKINPPTTTNLKRQIYFWNVECIGQIALGERLGFLDLLKHDESDEQYIKGKEFVESLFNVYVESANLMDISVKQAKKLEMTPWKNLREAMDTMLEYGQMYVQRAIEGYVENPSENIRESLAYKALIQEKLDEKMVKSVINDIFLGSPDTTSHTAIWALYLLGRNPDVANKAREEIASVLNRQALSLDTLNEMQHLNCIIKETLRMYSPAPFINRIMKDNINLCDYLVPSKTVVYLSLFTMGMDHANFSYPDKFIPERWLTKGNPKYPNHVPTAHIPFSHGSRKCVGFRVANLDLSLLLLEMLKNFEWTVEEEVEPILRMIMVPSKNIKLNLKPL